MKKKERRNLTWKREVHDDSSILSGRSVEKHLLFHKFEDEQQQSRKILHEDSL